LRGVGLLDTVILPGGVQGLLLAAALAARRTNRLANRILAALVASMSLMLLLGVVERRWAWAGHPHLLGLTGPLPFLFAPLLYLYVVALTRPASRFEPRWAAHGLLFAASAAFWLQSFYLRPGAEKLALARAYGAGEITSTAIQLFNLALLLQAMAYLLASWIALRAYSRRIEGFFSDPARIDLRWLRAMVVAHAAVWTIVIAAGLLRLVGAAPASLQGLAQAIQVGTAVVVFLTGYVSLWQPELFDKAQAAAQKPLPKYQRNRLEPAEAEALAREIRKQMEQRKLYRDSALTLQMLADAVGAPPHTVSQVLNLHLRKSFFVLVNSYRAEELMAALLDPSEKRGVLDLALEAGFNSKSTLNSFFKRYTSRTPSEFRAQAKSPRLSTG
jgi:AraC-like DNA-binding protein